MATLYAAIGAVVVVLGLALLYGRAKGSAGAARERAADAKANREATEAHVADYQRRRRRSGRDVLRERAAREKQGPVPADD